MKRSGDGRFEKEDTFIVEVLENLTTDLKTDKPVAQVLDSYACQLTAYRSREGMR
jgi:hypothetical protein